MVDKEYLENLTKRVQNNRIVREFQDTALQIAELLDDGKHTDLYMKLAKNHSKQDLLEIAKDVAQRGHIEHKGAYFMRILKEKGFFQKNGKHRDTTKA